MYAELFKMYINLYRARQQRSSLHNDYIVTDRERDRERYDTITSLAQTT